MPSVLFIIIAVPIVGVLIHWLYHLLKKPSTLPPGPFPLPVIGNLHLFLFREPETIFRSLHRKYGGAVTICIGHSIRQVIILDGKLIEEVFNGRTTAEITANRPKLPGIDGGLLFAPWPEAIDGRKYSLRCLNSFGLSGSAQKLVTCGTVVQDEIADFCAFVDSVVGQPINPADKVRECLASCVMVPLHGRRLDMHDPRVRELFELGELTFDASIGTFVLLILVPQLGKFMKHDFITGVARMKQIFLEWINEELPKRICTPTDTPADFIDCYIQAKAAHNDDQMTKESFAQLLADLFLASQDTTSQTTKWILFYLAKHPQWQTILQREIDSVVGQNEVPTLTHRGGLVKLQGFINEVMRHTSFVQFVMSRFTKEDFSFTMDGKCYTIPKCSGVYYVTAVAHGDKDYWGDPKAFRPERWWTDEQPPKLKNHTHFLPFGSGKRNCIGEQAARTVIFLFLTSVLQRFSFRLAKKDIPLDAHIQRANRNPPNYELIFERRS